MDRNKAKVRKEGREEGSEGREEKENLKNF